MQGILKQLLRPEEIAAAEAYAGRGASVTGNNGQYFEWWLYRNTSRTVVSSSFPSWYAVW